MIRTRWLIAALLFLPLPVGAQLPEWTVIACTVEHPESQRGTPITLHFSENGQVQFGGTKYPATVTSAEIKFCFAIGKDGQTCYTISRISGRFAAIGFGNLGGETRFNGSCVPEGTKPKF